VSQTQTFAGGTNWREIRSLIQVPETKRPEDRKCCL